VERQLGPIEIIVNMTGGPPPTPASGQRPEDWTRFFTSMVVSVIAITDAVLPGMRERGWGRIITNTSSGVVAPIPNLDLSNVLRSSHQSIGKRCLHLPEQPDQVGIRLLRRHAALAWSRRRVRSSSARISELHRGR
jgi:NAD(P)-dependent dehydrogenase (short-subunit alcohol dehydrogenase family)